MKIDGGKFMNIINYNDFIQNILNTRGRFECGDEWLTQQNDYNNKENENGLYSRNFEIPHRRRLDTM